jgi:hypothetical protein
MRHKNMQDRASVALIVILTLGTLAFSQMASAGDTNPSASSPPQAAQSAVTAADVGVSFVEGSTSQVMVQRDGKNYVVDLATHQVREVATPEPPAASASSLQTANPAQTPAESAPAKKKDTVYKPGDDNVFSVPTGRRVARHGLYINFTHRFPYEPAFTTPGRGATLLGLDDFAIPSFGFRYGVTSRLYVFAYRSPSVIGRPIELMAGYNFLDEHDGNPVNAAVRFSVDGQNDFNRNFAENFELIVSRSLGRRAQLYAVPTFSIHARPLLSDPNPSLADALPYQPCSAALATGISPSFNVRPCANTVSLGMAASVDIRPTVAVVAEVTPTLVNGRELGIHRPSYAYGIQKKIWRHAFTLGFTNGPSTIVSQRAGTNATFIGDPKADKPGGMFIGFDLTRQVF